jgi:Ca2+-binding RTX toxin-like protein
MEGLFLVGLLSLGLLAAVFQNGDDPITSDGGDGDGDGDGSTDPILGTDGDDLLTATGSETIFGGAGNDTLSADEGSDGAMLNGEDGDDTLTLSGTDGTADGGAGDDTITAYGTGGTVAGGEGDDAITVLGTADSISGGTGDDTIQVDSGLLGASGPVDGGAGDDRIVLTESATATTQEAIGGAGDDTLRSELIDGEAGADVLTGGTGADQFEVFSYNTGGDPSAGADLGNVATITDFNAAEDRLVVDLSSFPVFATPTEAANQIDLEVTDLADGSGSDLSFTIINAAADGAVTGTIRLEGVTGLDPAAIDFATSPGSVDGVLNGTPGSDVITAEGDDTVFAGAGDDSLSVDGDANGAVLNGEEGNDRLRDGGVNVQLNGGAGNDSFFGGDAEGTVMDGGEGDDAFYLAGGGDTQANGGAGNDIFEADTTGVDVVLSGGDGDDDFYVGGEGGTINGDAGNDTIGVEGGGWEIFGGTGDDAMTVAYVADGAVNIFTGGAGADVFTLAATSNAQAGSGEDADLGVVGVITDFSEAEDALVLDLRDLASGDGMASLNAITTTLAPDGSYTDVTFDITLTATGAQQLSTIRLAGVDGFDADGITVLGNAAA